MPKHYILDGVMNGMTINYIVKQLILFKNVLELFCAASTPKHTLYFDPRKTKPLSKKKKKKHQINVCIDLFLGIKQY